MSRRAGARKTDWLMKTLIVLFWLTIFAVFFAIVIGINLWITGGDWACVFSKDAAICAAINRGDRP